MEDLKGVGLKMSQQARDLQGMVMQSKASVEPLRTETIRQRDLTKSVVADIKAALAQAKKVPQSEEMHKRAVTAEATATEVNSMVVDTLNVLDEAATHSSRAAHIALQAVSQATENALKLQAIGTLMEKVQKEVKVAGSQLAGTEVQSALQSARGPKRT